MQVTIRVVLVVMAAGAMVRLLLLRFPRLWYDEATVGLMGLYVLRGELPIYFTGQPFMGALDAYLAAPVYLVLGASAGTLELMGFLTALTLVGLTVVLAWQGFGPRTALFTALVLVIPPDYLLFWSHEGRPVYLLCVVLGTLATLLALRAPELPRARAVAAFGVLGFVLGLALWTNFLSLVYAPAVGILVLRRGLAPLLPAALAGVPAFVLASLPHWLYGIPHGTALPPPGRRVAFAEVVSHWDGFRRVAWHMLIGVPADLRETRAGAFLALALTLVYGLAALAVIRAIRRGVPRARATGLALSLVVLVNVGVAVGSQYGYSLGYDARYLVPLYTALPILLGHWLAGLAWRPAAVLTGALLTIHAADGLGGEFRSFTPVVAAAQRAELQRQLETIAELEQAGLRRFYAIDGGTRVLTFLAGERVVFSNWYEEIYPRYVTAVDGAGTAGWWLGRRAPTFEASWAALGARFRFRSGGYVDFAVPAQALREIDPSRLVVTASEGREAAGRIVDRDLSSLWRTARPKQGGEWLQVDLGTPEAVAMVRWLPGRYQEVPGGLRLEASLDGRAWETLVDVPEYVGPLYWSAGRAMGRVRSGRVELRVPAINARHVRITQTGRSPSWHWTVRELFVYAAVEGPPTAALSADGPALARALRGAGVTHLYADHGWGARVALADPGIGTLPANLALDAYNAVGPQSELSPTFRWQPGRAALLEPVDAAGFRTAARASGLGVTERPAAGLTLFTYAPPPASPGTPLPATDLRVTASREAERAALAIDGDPGTRWATARPQAAGDWFRIDLAAPRSVRAVRLWTDHVTDWPRGLVAEGSEDGTTWRPIPAAWRTEGRLRWGGIALLQDGIHGVRLDFAATRLRSLRLTLSHGDPVFDWSIHALTVYAD